MAIESREACATSKRVARILAGIAILAVWPVAAQAQSDSPRAEVTWSGGSGMAELQIHGDSAQVMLQTPDGNLSQLRSVDTVDDALAVLADERLAFLWPALLAWAGDDLHILRDKALSRAERVADQGGRPLAVEGRAKLEGWSREFWAFRQYMSALVHAGRTSDAIARIQAEIASPTLGDNTLVRAQIQLMLANVLFDDGATSQAIAVLEKASADARSNAAKTEADVNLALMLALVGQYDRALTIDDAAEQDFDRMGSGILVGHRKLPDSHAYFAAIRACALDGLGRHDEAQATLATIGSEPETALDLSVRAESRLLAYSCMHDAAGLANELAADIQAAPPAAKVFLQFQPAREVRPAERETLAKAISMDTAIKAMSGRVRVLGGNLIPALSSWRDASAAPSRDLR